MRALYAEQCVRMAEQEGELFEAKRRNSELEDYIIQVSLSFHSFPQSTFPGSYDVFEFRMKTSMPIACLFFRKLSKSQRYIIYILKKRFIYSNFLF